MRTGIYRTDSGELEMVVETFDAAVEDMTNRATVEVPEGWPDELAWDAGTRTFGPNLAGWRAARWADAFAYREQRAGGGCMTPSGRVQTDAEKSLVKINGASSAAIVSKMAGLPFSVDFTMEDNSVEVLDADGMIAVGMAVVAYVNECQKAGTAIRDAIDAAPDKAAIDAIDITAGYP